MKPENEDRWDRWLDGALKKYGEAEPRAGLERRISASLGAAKRPVRWNWGWSFAAAMILAIAGLSVWLIGAHSHQTVISNESAKPNPVAGVEDTGKQRVSVRTGAARTPHRHIRQWHELARKRSPEPTLAQFPSQRPLSEQERLLEEYVSQFPEQAKLVAQEQAQAEKEMDQLYAANAQRISQQER